MPENKQIHDLPIAEQTSSSDLFETEIPSQLMQSGFASRKVSAAEIADLLLNDMTYPQALQTTAKKIIPAINEAAQSGGGGGASVVQKTMAEYEALPSSEKMNGSIYKITDKALIYCLDEEYHAVKEITSADYAQLTSDEKNNGTLYIITDEETTAADIPYSSGVSVADKLDNVPQFETLTTGDNNKLLGVSVSGGDISVDAVSSLFKIVAFNLASCTVNANSVRILRGNEFTDTTDIIPTGYSPIAISGEYNTNNAIKFIKVEATQAGNTGFFVTLGNDTASNQTGYIQVKILYIKNSLL